MAKLTIPAPELTSKQLEAVQQAKAALTGRVNALLAVIGKIRTQTQKLEEIEGQLEQARNAASRSLSPEVHSRSQTLLSVHGTAKNLLEQSESQQRPLHENLHDAITDANDLISNLASKYLRLEIDARAQAAFAPFFASPGYLANAIKDLQVRGSIRNFLQPQVDIMRGGEHLLKHANSRLAILEKLADQAEDFFEFEGCSVE